MLFIRDDLFNGLYRLRYILQKGMGGKSNETSKLTVDTKEKDRGLRVKSTSPQLPQY